MLFYKQDKQEIQFKEIVNKKIFQTVYIIESWHGGRKISEYAYKEGRDEDRKEGKIPRTNRGENQDWQSNVICLICIHLLSCFQTCSYYLLDMVL